MPAVKDSALIQGLVSAFEASSCNVFISPSVPKHPRKFVLISPNGDSVEVWVYLWSLTPGGRPSLPFEYRIQITTASSPLAINPNGPTVLLGYKGDENLFAGFDLAKHRTFTKGSPSVQIDIRVLRQAQQTGFSFNRKTNDEIAVGIRPDQLLSYAQNAAQLHLVGADAKALSLLQLAVDLKPIPQQDMDLLPLERMRMVQTISTLSRDASFRKKVLKAYANKCAVTGVQFQLVDAAHILPVAAYGSSDDVTNGISLSPTFHRAYDLGLIHLSEDLRMLPNPQKIAQLKALNLGSGEAVLFGSMGKLSLPALKSQWPSIAFIKKANTFRKIKA